MLNSCLKPLAIGLCLITVANAQNENSKSREQNIQRQRPQKTGNMARGTQRNRPDADGIFRRLDKDNNGQLTPDEVPQRLQNRLKSLDQDGSGSISLKEMKSGIAKQNRKRIGSPAEAEGRQPSEARKRQKMDGPQAAESMFKRMDRNGDGIISKDEAPNRMKERFAKMDKNGNEQLDKNEIVAILEIMKAEGGNKTNRYNTDPSKTRPVNPKRPPRR